ncbi:hypothetical protein SD70_01740 [Gordoniibacillus kamchatkensis]|uniref:Nudix hydrolase domain-containing protein n=1 Tax=Gordoniibacillus kamchatkensis TaxID=1590651 RepID=A0ABR5AMU1_9BACL|nr:8-oxo-dGTP diphosphatase [Paenibacillus sp. VKM B-2647]KIL42277.1 hypothetical protein SD70_01740 [Paenibacillus sp. VKM B-2647]
MIAYNICFIRQGNSFLLLNREFPSWMGCWNGVGGKLEKHESPRPSMIREIGEETGLSESEYRLEYKGLVSWTVDRHRFGGMYLYVAGVSEDAEYRTPVKTAEGILDWKAMEWILHPDNRGIAASIPAIMKYLFEPSPYHHHCTYLDGKLAAVSSEAIDAATEDSVKMEEYVKSFEFSHAVK